MSALSRVALRSCAMGLLAVGCATPRAVEPGERPFDFARDTFSYPNELYWHYEIGTGSIPTTARHRDEPVENGQRCIAMARATRQFFRAARFAPEEPRLRDSEYRARIRAVLDSDPRDERPVASPVAIPGYPDLRSFSRDREELVKEELGGRLAAYTQRGNWRMIFPFSPRHQRATAQQLLDDLARGRPPIVHLVNFPRIDINHAMVVFAAEETPLEIRFTSYDPNDPDAPVSLVFERASATFRFGRTDYFRGGPVKVYEIYDGFFF